MNQPTDDDLKELLFGLYGELLTRDQEIKELREEKNAAILLFCEEHTEFELKSVKNEYKFFKQLVKDKSATIDAECQREKIVEMLLK